MQKVKTNTKKALGYLECRGRISRRVHFLEFLTINIPQLLSLAGGLYFTT